MDQDNSVQSDLIGMSRGGVGEKAFVTKTATLTGKQANVRGKKNMCQLHLYDFIHQYGWWFRFREIYIFSRCLQFVRYSPDVTEAE